MTIALCTYFANDDVITICNIKKFKKFIKYLLLLLKSFEFIHTTLSLKNFNVFIKAHDYVNCMQLKLQLDFLTKNKSF